MCHTSDRYHFRQMFLKYLKRYVYNRLIEYIKLNYLIDNVQHGFWLDRSVITAANIFSGIYN